MTLPTGTKLGPYEIVASIGSGGMGEVYKARDTRLERVVAIKVLPESMAKDSARLTRFHQEARALSALNHPNLLAIFDVGAENGTNFIVSEYLEGRSEEHTSELQSQSNLVCRLLLEKKKKKNRYTNSVISCASTPPS